MLKCICEIWLDSMLFKTGTLRKILLHQDWSFAPDLLYSCRASHSCKFLGSDLCEKSSSYNHNHNRPPVVPIRKSVRIAFEKPRNLKVQQWDHRGYELKPDTSGLRSRAWSKGSSRLSHPACQERLRIPTLDETGDLIWIKVRRLQVSMKLTMIWVNHDESR